MTVTRRFNQAAFQHRLSDKARRVLRARALALPRIERLKAIRKARRMDHVDRASGSASMLTRPNCGPHPSIHWLPIVRLSAVGAFDWKRNAWQRLEVYR